jgi:hypothetical protein
MSKATADVTFSKNTVRAWMSRHLEEHRSGRTGEVNWTGLCEAATGRFDMDHEGGPLDDYGHWIWDLAIEVDAPRSEASYGRGCP